VWNRICTKFLLHQSVVSGAEGEVTNGNCLSRSMPSETFPRAFTLPELIAYVDATAAWWSQTGSNFSNIFSFNLLDPFCSCYSSLVPLPHILHNPPFIMVVERRENVTHHCAYYNFSPIHICAFLILWLLEIEIERERERTNFEICCQSRSWVISFLVLNSVFPFCVNITLWSSWNQRNDMK